MKAVIMAGGKGTRLRPLTCNIPKPMVPLVHKPVMEYSIELLKKYGITEIAVTLQYLPDVIKDYFGDGSQFGVKLHYFVEKLPLGTAGSIKNAQKFLDERFVVISGDGLTDFNLSKGIQFHLEKNALATIFMKQVETPLDYGVILTNENNEVVRFIEKPNWNEVFSDTVNTGIYVLEPEIFTFLEEGVPTDFSKDTFPLLMKEKQAIFGFKADGYWSDVGNLYSYRETQFDMLKKKVQVSLLGNETNEGIWIGKNVHIEDDVTLNGPISIGDGTVIRSGSILDGQCIIGKHSILSTNCTLKKSILWNDIYVGDSSELRGTTICKGTKLENSASLYEASVIGEQCTIASNAIIKPEVKVWPNKTIEESAIVHTSLIWGKKITRSLFNGRGVSGLANVEITPDFFARLASAYGAVLPQGGKIVLGSDSYSITNLMKSSFQTGILSAGISTVDIGITIPPIVRFTVEREPVIGGVYFRFVNRNGEMQISAEFYDGKGYPISAELERKIENAFWQEDYRRASFDQIGFSASVNNVEDSYINSLISLISIKQIKNANLKVIIGFEHCHHFYFVPKLLEKLNCEIYTVPNHKAPIELSKYVQGVGGDLGILIGETGEFLKVITEEGEIVADETMLALYIMLHFYEKKEGIMAIPHHGSSELDILAKRLGGKIVRTKADPRSIMEKEGSVFTYLFDAQYAFIHIVEMMTKQNIKLSQLIKMLPSIHLLSESVYCPKTAKGLVMRILMQENSQSKIELLDGIKVHHPDGGWTLILPDREKPVFTVYSQAKDLNIARQQSSNYVKKILNIQKYQDLETVGDNK
ncbi:sugar phosphate nucleotidyltransferase [Anaerobacillus isosaccharinicus]|uniref:NTP transferase domain-containing protein n=1 Tax=Anaerobacillus isosaccharinicus TaxID=1532552 RepID=A0A1S2LRC6_9BACI|nr:sugar phosphate nucleotidyltransferase [Anaerobacillus isosaccharinicus]MBA5585548.1 NTP transferase domain-containing protein [Anaerobacillus isosaccharinicus]QOY36138.1 NTP transferase domain-containing protein [Anaerobacillus isosaccharinicus]